MEAFPASVFNPAEPNLACIRCGVLVEHAEALEGGTCAPCLDRNDGLNAQALCVTSLLLCVRMSPYWLLFCLPLVLIALLVHDPRVHTAMPLVNLLLYLPIVTGIMLALGRRSMRGAGPSVWRCLWTGFARYIPVMATTVIRNVIIFLASLLFVVPGVQRTIDYLVAVPIATFEGVWGRDALRASTYRVQGIRWTLFFAMMLTQGPSVIVSFVRPEWNALWACLQLPAIMFSVVLYERTQHREGICA